MASKKTSEDVVLLGPPLSSGPGRHVLRKRGERIEHGALRPAEEGKPLHGELVKLEPRSDPGIYDVEVLHDARPAKTDEVATADRSGPAQVATDEYRRGWNRLFHKKALPS